MPTTSSQKKSSLAIFALILAWFVAVAAGSLALQYYAAKPGEVSAAPRQWPAQSALATAKNQPQLLLFMHPHCPCSRSSLSELERIVSKSHGRAAFTVVVVLPEGAQEGFELSDTVARARSITGVTVFLDRDGREAALFDARTSGQVLVYDSSRQLNYCGGITGSRGHEGDNRGAACALDCLTGNKPETQQCDSFGCPLTHAKGRP